MPSLREMFVDVPVRESAGGRTGERYQYQWNWALAHVLDLHKRTEDYLVAFDYHDDVIDFDSAGEPTAIRFYQVKTREIGGWKRAKLLSRTQRKVARADSKAEYLLSPIAKMYYNKIIFPEHTKSISFVTNAPLELPVLPGTNPRNFSASEFQPATLSKIATQLREEHGLSTEPDVGNLMLFEQSQLTLEDYTVQLKGRIGDFLEVLYPSEKFRVGAIYRALIGEITIRCKPGSEPPSGFEEFVRTRCISRDHFQRLLGYIGVGPSSLEDRWARAETQLVSDGMAPMQIKAIRSQWRLHEIDRLDPAKHTVRELAEAIRQVLAAMLSDVEASGQTLPQLLDRVVTHERVTARAHGIFDRPYLCAAALMEFYES